MSKQDLLPPFLASLLLSVSTLAACAGPDSARSGECDNGKCDYDKSELQLCAAVRGNGELIASHFASLARIVEHFGTIDGAAGGSSASITIFMMDSMQANPATRDCGDTACGDAETAARTALLLKSFPGYLQHLSTTEEAAAFGELLPIVSRIQEAGVQALLDEDVASGVSALVDILSSEDLRDLINPELVSLLQSSPNPEKHARDILDGVEKLGSFSADTDKILIRPGLLDFAGLADKLGRAADFYAGYGPSDPMAMEAFMSSCATPGLGMGWFEVAGLPAAESTCGELFDSMLGDYRAALAESPNSFESRLDEPIGSRMAALISTSILSGDTAASFAQARADYNAAEDYELLASFDDVSFGYWGDSSDLSAVSRNANGYDDLKTAKFRDLGEASWRTALSYSPAEPGLARALELPDGQISAGGWSDLHPVLALRNLGCENVVYVTRTGEESGFAMGVAGLLGMTEGARSSLYDLDADSSYALSLSEADATWCTNWNAQSGTDLFGISEDGYTAPMESTNSFFTAAERAYDNLRDATNLRGCTPGAAPAAE